MMSLRSKLVIVAAIPAIISGILIAMSTTMDGGRDAYAVRLSLWILAFGGLVCLVVWDLHRVAVLKLDLAFADARADAAERRADAAEERVDKIEQRLAALEDDAECRDIAKRLLSGEGGTELLRTLLHMEEDRN